MNITTDRYGRIITEFDAYGSPIVHPDDFPSDLGATGFETADATPEIMGR